MRAGLQKIPILTGGWGSFRSKPSGLTSCLCWCSPVKIKIDKRENPANLYLTVKEGPYGHFSFEWICLLRSLEVYQGGN